MFFTTCLRLRYIVQVREHVIKRRYLILDDFRLHLIRVKTYQNDSQFTRFKFLPKSSLSKCNVLFMFSHFALSIKK